jgi:hypothetical protein
MNGSITPSKKTSSLRLLLAGERRLDWLAQLQKVMITLKADKIDICANLGHGGASREREAERNGAMASPSNLPETGRSDAPNSRPRPSR